VAFVPWYNTSMTDTDFAIAIFPFLKTSEPVRIGGYNFRPTEDIEGLPPRQAKAIGELAEMLFAQDDLRVKSASYAILPNMEVHSGDRRLTQLATFATSSPTYTRLRTMYSNTSSCRRKTPASHCLRSGA
jgi:hypothetical protein